jgi:uncharacterized repeat protein (TIGR03803 family)
VKRLSRHIGSAVGISFGVALLVACGGSHVTLPGVAQAVNGPMTDQPAAGGYSSLYSFRGSPDGAYPITGLTPLNGKLYGTTGGGGVPSGYGTAFKISTSGKERVLYRFTGGADGNGPNGLTASNGALYGTTRGGGRGCPGSGSGGCGTVFRLSLSGNERVLYRFKGGSDGATPIGSLIVANNELYGSTFQGGLKSQCTNTNSNGCGTVFKVSMSGEEQVLYRFAGGSDGANPEGQLLDESGTLFGTTPYGGKSGCDPQYPPEGCGTTFDITASGAENVLYRFSGKGNGGVPLAGLIEVDGTFYGTTSQGGSGCDPSGCGIVFKMTGSGDEVALYRFKNSPDGAIPYGLLLAANGALFGTTIAGGRANCGGSNGVACGTIYRIATSGSEQVLYRFKGEPDGSAPQAGLTAFGGSLYGTTEAGGSGCDANGPLIGRLTGCGTVFRISKRVPRRH